MPSGADEISSKSAARAQCMRVAATKLNEPGGQPEVATQPVRYRWAGVGQSSKAQV